MGNVAINGFGRIGRSILRIIVENDSDINVVAINDLGNYENLAYLLKHDSVMGILDRKVSVAGDKLIVDDRTIQLTSIKDPAELPWKEMDVDVVVESTGIFRDSESLNKHLDAGAKKVLLTVPPKDDIDATIVLGVNDGDLKPEDKIVSNASCTTNCLAPIAKVLDDNFGIISGLMTTVHAYTNDQALAETTHSDFRRGRSATQNIIPTSTGAAKAVGMVLPELNGKLDGMAMRVPVPDGSVVDLVVELEKKVSIDDINKAVKNAADNELNGILEYSEVPLVSTDILNNPHSSIYDASSTQLLEGNHVKVVCWYDNEWGYSNRVVDLIGNLLDNG
ncbi:type I glyceraldehyde-3-phosphate dehydrogenase [bacterium]|jgi:glyceraldehyde 3-phosphate dehydrogenase|nr:type I glyceraldehyde-3-phosphate dehydrogenase [bacterium]MDC2989070.1 type I glyceraldehyde-3-phosphate dehydrogenase [Acidimicrobiaceae bacterium]GIR90619.1 MAG: glyceraldehyde-3-phosphate dehydrogenase [Actinomycetota bacterium]|tara:strand:- start:505 stop:1509 length:1005 start_codon:yes stop_codon:yes gene_type:complete